MLSSSDSGVPSELLPEDEDTHPISMRQQILVVDDVPANLLSVEAALAPLKRPIVSALSGHEALARLLEADFSLLLLDVQMPDMDGYETAQLIRSRERTRHLPIIFLTAHNFDQSAVLRAYRLGVADFLFKPIEPDILRAKAEVFLLLQDRTQELAQARLQRAFDKERRDYEAKQFRREVEREQASRQQLARLNEELADKDRRKDEFLAILSHELRNPLAPLRVSVDLIKRSPDLPMASGMIDVLDRQVHVLTRLVDDLLDVSRITANKFELRSARVDLRGAVDLAIETSQPMIDARGHALVTARPPEPVHVSGDPVRLAQVISNLLNNAARYTERGGTIELVCGIEADRAFVRVADNGMGIPPSLIDTVFDMFVQERVRSDGSGGLGLGLALGRHLVSLHGGTIRVASPGRDQGSTFQIDLPLAATAEESRAEAILTSASESRLRVVIVDDNTDFRDMTAALLTALGHDVLIAPDGLTGLSLIREHEPDAALVDIGLPDIDGLELVRTLREHAPGLATRLVALTGYGDVQFRERVKAAGFDVHLVKPATAATIVECLSKPST